MPDLRSAVRPAGRTRPGAGVQGGWPRTIRSGVRVAVSLVALLALVACGTGAGAGTRAQPAGNAPAAQPAAQAAGGDRAVGEFYRGKTLHLVVGYDAGGG